MNPHECDLEGACINDENHYRQSVRLDLVSTSARLLAHKFQVCSSCLCLLNFAVVSFQFMK